MADVELDSVVSMSPVKRLNRARCRLQGSRHHALDGAAPPGEYD